MPFYTDIEEYRNEMLDEIRLFYPNFLMQKEPLILQSYTKIRCQQGKEGDKERGICRIKISQSLYEYQFFDDAFDVKKKKTFLKLCVYKALSEFCRRSMPWGSLTGIRPTKLAFDMLNAGGSIDEISEYLQREYLVSKEKSLIIREIIENQSSFSLNERRDMLLYVHIPFCKSICSYCAFTAEPVHRNREIIGQYTKSLVLEITHAKQLIKDMGYSVAAIYIGGGTPTSIDDEYFEEILAATTIKGVEFTCEAGRPDTISQSKLRLMKKYGVKRLCVNPQTLNDETLKLIGRSHNSQQFFSAFAEAQGENLDINVDLIAGLPNENFHTFKQSLEGVLSLLPSNITIHTLSIKNGTQLKNDCYEHCPLTKEIIDMTEFAYKSLKETGYSPYYLYRQKHMAENLENIGYSRQGKLCLYNVASMEEKLPVMAAGAGGISKMLYERGRIERHANLRDVRLYIQQHEERLLKKSQFFLQP